MNDMVDALRLIAARSEAIGHEAVKLLIRPGQQPYQQHHYNLVARHALGDSAANWTAEERALILRHIEADEPEPGNRRRTLRVRLTDGEMAQVQAMAEAEGQTISELVRQRICLA